jgi:hypothetical protein
MPRILKEVVNGIVVLLRGAMRDIKLGPASQHFGGTASPIHRQQAKSGRSLKCSKPIVLSALQSARAKEAGSLAGTDHPAPKAMPPSDYQ